MNNRSSNARDIPLSPPANERITPEIVVKELLQIGDFIEKHEPQIFSKLEESDENIITAINEGKIDKTQDFVMFMCQALPLISSVIQIGSTLQHLNNATDEVRDKLKNADAVSVLSALTFVYIVEERLRKGFQGQEKKKQIWDRISGRVQKLGT